jgi:hypothetical protein
MGQIYKLISSQPFPLHLYKIYFSWVKNKWIFLDLAIFKNPKIQGRHRHCLFVSCDDTWGAEQNYQLLHYTRSHIHKILTTYILQLSWQQISIKSWADCCIRWYKYTRVVFHLQQQGYVIRTVMTKTKSRSETLLYWQYNMTVSQMILLKHTTQHATHSHIKGTALHCTVQKQKPSDSWNSFNSDKVRTFNKTHALKTFMLKKSSKHAVHIITYSNSTLFWQWFITLLSISSTFSLSHIKR